MSQQFLGIIMNGVTGRMGANQHLARSIAAIRIQGGVPLPSGDTVMPDPILVGRDERKLHALASAHGIERWSTDLSNCLSDPRYCIYFDAQTTLRRADVVRAAIAAGKHIYCENEVPQTATHDNAFKAQWALFLAHLAAGTPFPWTLLEGAKGTQLTQLGLQSWHERRTIEVPALPNPTQSTDAATI